MTDFNNIAILDGGKSISDTELALFRKLTNSGFAPIVIDNLFEHPEKLALLKSNNIKTIVTGTLRSETLEPLLKAFDKMQWLPENAIITRGEDLFRHFSDKVNMFVLMPMNFSTDGIELIPLSEW